MQSPTPEVLAPVGVLVVDHQEGEAALLAAEALAARRTRHRRAQDRGTLYKRAKHTEKRRKRIELASLEYSWDIEVMRARLYGVGALMKRLGVAREIIAKVF